MANYDNVSILAEGTAEREIVDELKALEQETEKTNMPMTVPNEFD